MSTTTVQGEPPVAPVPERVGKYRIDRELGRAGISRVFLGHDPFADRAVAIKAIRKDGQMPSIVRERFETVFLNEASIARRLAHPHIVKIHDAAIEDDLFYIVMDPVEGGSIERHCEVDSLLPLHAVVELVFKCALALDFAGRQGILHLDIKPSNVLLDKNNEVRLTDFGFVIPQETAGTQLESIRSPLYMSPEQLEDKPATHQSDIYALGIVLYRLLTGKLPYSASNNVTLLFQILNAEPTAPGVHRADLPAELDRIVMKAIAKKPAARYQTWIEFARDLAGLNKDLSLPQDTITDTEKFSALKAVKFFREFADLEAWETVRIASFHRVPPGETLVREGETCDSFFLIVEGGARVSKGGKSVSVLGDEDCFGEMPYFADRGPRTSSVTSVTPMTVIEVKAEAFRKSSDACQKQFNRAFLRILHDRIERLSQANLQMADKLRKAQQESSGSASAE